MEHSKSLKNRKAFLRGIMCLILTAAFLSGCGSKEPETETGRETAETRETRKQRETKTPIETKEETPSSQPAAPVTKPAPTETVPVPTQKETEAAEDPHAEEETDIFLMYSVDVNNFGLDYGFSENRAWVRDAANNKLLIDTKGEVIYEVPQNVCIEGNSRAVYFEQFCPMQNGTAYFTGRVDYEYYISVIIDADGNELASFVSNDKQKCLIGGRTDDRFLLLCVDSSGLDKKLYCIPLGTDGKPADVPRLITEGNVEDYPGVIDHGEGFFSMRGCAFYNLNNNTVQKTERWEATDGSARFYGGITLSNGYLLTADMLQEDRINLVLSNPIGYRWLPSNSHLNQFGRIWTQYNSSYNRMEGLYDQSGNQIDIPQEIGSREDSYANMVFYDDGYVMFVEYSDSGKTLLSLMDPDNNFLYLQKVYPAMVNLGHEAGGYVIVEVNSGNGAVFGILDREGEVHAFGEDLSGLDGLSELRFNGVGSGFLLETGLHLGEGYKHDENAVIISFDGKTRITSVRKTSRTQVMDSTLKNETVIDLSAAKPVGRSGSAAAAELTTDDEIRAMDEYGVIVVDPLLGESRDQLMFEQDGVSIILRTLGAEHYFEVKNDNPDNKKVDVTFSDKLFYDGVYIDRLRGTQKGTGWLKSGESASVYYSIVESDGMFMTEISTLATGLAELPLTELSFHFRVQIGSMAEAVNYTRVLRTRDWTEDDWDALYGDPVGDFSYNGELIYSVYRIQDERSSCFAIRNRTDTELFAKMWPWFAECQWYVNGEKWGGIFSLLIPPEGAGIVNFANVDSVYKELELPNGTPIRLSLRVPVPGLEEGGVMIDLDLGEISE